MNIIFKAGKNKQRINEWKENISEKNSRKWQRNNTNSINNNNFILL